MRRTGDEVHITGDDALVVAGIVFVTGLGGEAGAVAAVVEEEVVAGAGEGDEFGDGAADVGSRGLGIGLVGVDEDSDVLLRKAVALHQAPVHPPHVVDATLQLRLRPRVVAPH